MKLLTHNMLTSKCLKGVTVGYPLGIVVSFGSVHNFKVNLNKHQLHFIKIFRMLNISNLFILEESFLYETGKGY